MIDLNKTGQNFKRNISAGIVCIVGIFLNLILAEVVSVLDLPLYLDTVGTILVAAMGGYLPGVLVGFFTNVIKCIMDPTALYYGVLNVLIAICAAFFGCHGGFKSFKGIIFSVLVFTFIGGGLGSFIPLFVEELTLDSEALKGTIYGTGRFSLVVSHILSGILMDLPDKAITVLLVSGILHFIPDGLRQYCSFSLWLQNPTDLEQLTCDNTEKSSARVVSLRAKAVLVLGVALTTVAAAGTLISITVFHKTIINDSMKLAQGTASLASTVVDGDHVTEYLERGDKAEGYSITKNRLKNILESSPNISFLYVYKIREDGCLVVFDIDTEDVQADKTGEIVPFDSGFNDYIPALLEGEEIPPVITDDAYGHLLTAYYPIYDSKGKCVSYAGADVKLDLIAVSVRSFLMEMISVFLGFFIIICTLVIWLMDYHIIYPVRAIKSKVDAFSFASDSQKNLDTDVKKFKEINVHTGDELESLYKALCSMTSNQAEQMRNIRRLSDSTAMMQDGLIITMADMVENRDSDTGAHIQKTASYVKIIAEGLKRKGYYKDQLTPKFMSDVVRSAPLHDVGKINIPDEVLNKPGRLTDEEYEIIKTHTTSGRNIMEHAINTVKGGNYLKEARNMAAYHHERWDGKGYPEGLSGEVIPLSARIMAVADVFDALTAPRVYKPAFPLEKALSIIEEGKGTQFDPKCVEVFMESMDEVKVVLRKYNQDSISSI